jgi:hypothetical protein
MQKGGGKCTLCGALGTNKSTCPRNLLASNPNPSKHNPLPSGLVVPANKPITVVTKPVPIPIVPKAAPVTAKVMPKAVPVVPVVPKTVPEVPMTPDTSSASSKIQEQLFTNFCKNASFTHNDDFSIRNLRFGANRSLSYNGKPAKYTIGNKLGSGTYGIVHEMLIDTIDGKYRCAIKRSSVFKQELDEIKVMDMFPHALTCDGIADMVRTPMGDIIMPLADGDLSKLATKVTLAQTVEMILQIGRQLQCLHAQGARYYDVKAENCLFFCRKQGRIDVALSDMGSLLPDSDGDFVSTIPPSKYHSGFIPGKYNEIEYYYTYLLLSLIFEMSNGSYMGPYNSNYYDYEARVNNAIKTYLKILDFNMTKPEQKPVAVALRDIVTKMDYHKLKTLPTLEEFLQILSKALDNS